MKAQPNNSRVNILGLKVNPISMDETLSFVAEKVEQNNFSQILTLNAEIAYLSYTNEDRIKLINNCDLVTPDGSGIMWASEKYGTPVPQRVAGIDLLQRLLTEGSNGRYKFYFLGAQEDTVKQAVRRVNEQYNVDIVGYHNGFFSEEESQGIVEDIRNSHANILFVAMGYPRQDLWIAKYGPQAGINVGIGVGGSFDVLAGKINRAPQFWQNMRLEWFYRLLKDPRRFKRTMNLPKFMSAVKKDIKSNKK